MMVTAITATHTDSPINEGAHLGGVRPFVGGFHAVRGMRTPVQVKFCA